MKNRPLILPAVGTALALALIITVVTLVSTIGNSLESNWVSPHNIPRPVHAKAYQIAMTDRGEVPYWEANDIFSSIVAQSSATQIILNYKSPYSNSSSSSWFSDPYKYNVKRWNAASQASPKIPLGANGYVELKAIRAMVYPKEGFSVEEFRREKVDSVPFDANGLPISLEKFTEVFNSENGWSPKALWFDGSLPVFDFLIEIDSGDQLESSFLDMEVWDSNTQAPVMDPNAGFATGGNGKYILERKLGLFRRTPVDLVFDVAVGPKEVFEINPDEIGKVFEYSEGQFSLVCVEVGKYGGWRNSSNQNTREMSIDLNRSYEGFTTLVCFHLSLNRLSRLQVAAIDSQGVEHPFGSGYSSGVVSTKSAHVKLSDIASFKVTRFPNYHRFIFSLPFLPGYPEENENVIDLLDTWVPYIRFRNEFEFAQSLEKITHMKVSMLGFNRAGPSIGASFFPKEFRNVTVRDILKEWNMATPKTRVRVNTDDFILDLAASPGGGFLEILSELF